MNEQPARLDDDQSAALDLILLFADERARWEEFEPALDLLDDFEAMGYALSPEYSMKRRVWERAADLGYRW